MPQENWIASRKFKQIYSLRCLPFSGAEINAVQKEFKEEVLDEYTEVKTVVKVNVSKIALYYQGYKR